MLVEPSLESLTGEKLKLASAIYSDEARLDITARGFWQRGQRAFFDVKVFNPNAQRHLGQTLAQCYISNEKDKKRSYCERVLEVENGTFTPLFSIVLVEWDRSVANSINVCVVCWLKKEMTSYLW